MMGRRLPLKTAAEQDTVTSMRLYLCYLARSGTTHGIKRQIRRRERRSARNRLRREPENV